MWLATGGHEWPSHVGSSAISDALARDTAFVKGIIRVLDLPQSNGSSRCLTNVGQGQIAVTGVPLTCPEHITLLARDCSPHEIHPIRLLSSAQNPGCHDNYPYSIPG